MLVLITFGQMISGIASRLKVLETERINEKYPIMLKLGNGQFNSLRKQSPPLVV